MNGLMMDTQLTLPILLRRVGVLLRRQGDRHPAARQELPPLHLPRLGAQGTRARGRPEGARPRARRPRRDALLEPLPAPRGLSRHPVRRLRAAHAEPASAPERSRVHREPRRGQGRDRRPQSDAAARALPRQDEDRARARGRGLLRGARRRLRPRRLGRPRAGGERGGGHVLHERHDRACRRASSTRTARRCCTRSASPRATRWGSASRSRT